MSNDFCPLCKGTTLVTYRGRTRGQCISCGAIERGRVIYALFEHFGLLDGRRDMLHIAPDPSLIPVFLNAYGDGYVAGDIRKHAFDGLHEGLKSVVIDVTDISPIFDDMRFDIILHSHVMEHIRASWPLTLLNLTTYLRPGGYHFFAIPIKKDWSQEDLSDLTPEQKHEKFGQKDHVRFIGRKDFQKDMRLIPKLAGLEFFKSASDIFSAGFMNRIAGDKDVYVMKRSG